MNQLRAPKPPRGRPPYRLMPPEQMLPPGPAAPQLPSDAGSSPSPYTGSKKIPATRARNREHMAPRRPAPLWDDPGDFHIKPLGARGRWIVRGLVFLILLTGLLLTLTQRGDPSTTSTPIQHQATPARSSSPTGTPATSHPTSTPTTSSARKLQDAASQFFEAYFSWSGGESEQAYLASWQDLVVHTSFSSLATASPRLALDNGNDSQATCAAPSIPVDAIEQQGNQAHVIFTWSIQVLPAGGELATWQIRHIQATIDLIQTTPGWLVSNIGWTSS